jgi:predicted transposase YdaD
MGMADLLSARHDRSYRLLFSHPRMVEDLLRRFLDEAWVEKLDFSTLEQANASHVSEGLHSRDGDVAWRLRLRDEPLPVYLLVEFQSEVQRFMALRQTAYLALFYQELVHQGRLTAAGELPPVLSFVVYNGKVGWWAPRELSELIRSLGGSSDRFVPRLRYRLLDMEAVPEDALRGPNLVALLIRLERSRTRSGLRAVIRELVAALAGEDEGGLRRAFVVWLQRVLLPGKGEEDIPELVDLKEFRAMLIERVEEWNRELEARGERRGLKKGLKRGLEKGLREGLEGQRDLVLRLLETKFGAIDSRTRARVKVAQPKSLLRWGERLITAERLSDVFAR